MSSAEERLAGVLAQARARWAGRCSRVVRQAVRLAKGRSAV